MEQYPDSDALLAGLASQMEQIGRPSEAAAFFEQAFAVKPDLPAVRIGSAGRRIAEDKLDEAHELLRFLESPGAGKLYPLGRLEELARAYQRAGRHAETLETCKHLLAEVPALGQTLRFRYLVAASEKALGRDESILPGPRVSVRVPSKVRWAAVAAAGLVLAAAGLLVANEYCRRHRTVFAARGGSQVVQLSIDGQPPVPVARLAKFQLAEGRHHVKVSEPVNEEFDIDLETGYFTRWTNSPVWVINADGGVALVVKTMHYAVNPRPSESQLAVGRRLFYIPHVDYPFTTPPRTIQVEGHGGETTKICLDRVDAPAPGLFSYAVGKCGVEPAFAYAEARLRCDREDVMLLYAYTDEAVVAGQTDRAWQFLKSGLGRQPISVPWHRAFQDLNRTPERRRALIAEYDQSLQKEPDNARLLYLRGRIDDDRAKQQMFFRRACAADAALAWPQMALAYDAASAAEWQQSRAYADKAFELELRYPGLEQMRHEARLATGDLIAMEKEYRRELAAAAPGEAALALVNLCDVLAAKDSADEARRALTDWENRVPVDQHSQELVLGMRQMVWYMLGDLAAVEQLDPAQAAESNARVQLHALLAAGRPKDAVQQAAAGRLLDDPWNALAVSLSFDLAGDRPEADKWREKACAGLERLDMGAKRAADLLRGQKAPLPSDLEQIVVGAREKSLLAAALATRFPSQRTELAGLARRLSVSHLPPYHLVRKALRDAH